MEFRKSDKDQPTAEIITSKGRVLVELFEDDAPNAVANFITLAESKFYDGQKFHRVIPKFMAQGGDPNSKDEDPGNDGSGGPGYTIKTEISRRNHMRGSLSYANAGINTDGSQFFLTVVPTFWLNGKHAVFGRVLEGMSIVDSLQVGDEIQSVTILSKRNKEYTVTKN
ncbi:MAG: peptidylprolyl isomerase [Candidatus Cloacimonetes bacterium]|nr:peptidylprolyl isomerase [Candidatus Cloacimonadota bacterium]